jgi:hypothetical protein
MVPGSIVSTTAGRNRATKTDVEKQTTQHPLRGPAIGAAIFDSWIVVLHHRGRPAYSLFALEVNRNDGR